MAKKYKPEYKKNDYVQITRGPYTGEKGWINKVRGIITKTYDVALEDHEIVLLKRPFNYLTMAKH